MRGTGLLSCCNNPTTKAVVFLLTFQFIILCIFIQLNLKSGNTNNSIQLITATSKHVDNAVLHDSLPTAASYENAIELINKTSQQRVLHMRDYCKENEQMILAQNPNYDLTGHKLTTWIWILSKHHDLFYCATPKCGSTTWKSYLMEDLRIDWKVDTHEAASELFSATAYFDKMKMQPSKILATHRPENRLIIVRNPWARVVSAYQDKVKVKHWSLRKLCYGWRKYKNVNEPSFKQFVDCLVQRPTDVLWESHTHPLTSLCGVCRMDYNIVLKLEELDSAEPYLMKALNFTLKPKYKPPQKQKYTNKYSEYFDEIPPEQIRQLQEVYKYDIDIFGYPKTPFE